MSCNLKETVFDCLVVGAGIEGSCTARQSAALGKKTLCLEQFPIPHDRGSSHGQSRITRYSYGQSFYADMMPECFALWEEIEKLAKKKLFINCGYLTINTYSAVDKFANNLKSNNVDGEFLNSQELEEKYRLHFPNNFVGLYERTGGMLLASKCLRAVQDQFVKFGGILRDNVKVTEVIPGSIVQVKTSEGTYKARTVVLTPGPWANSLLRPLGIDLHLKPKRISVYYWKVKQKGFSALDNYPCWGDETLYCKETFSALMYGVPCYEYPDMIKICLHNGPVIDPDSRDDVDYSWIERNVSQYIKCHVIGVETKPSIVEHCLYTVSPDENCILDRHPKFPNIVMGVGFSGSGFKLAPVIGKLLCQIAYGLEPSYNVEHFKIDRFKNRTSKSSL